MNNNHRQTVRTPIFNKTSHRKEQLHKNFRLRNNTLHIDKTRKHLNIKEMVIY